MQEPASCWSPPSLCLSILGSVNSRGVGVGGSTMVHGYRMCLGGYVAWLPSVCMSHSALLSHFLPVSLAPSLSFSLHIFCPSLILPSPNALSHFLSSFHSLSSSSYMVTAAAWGYRFIKERQRCAAISNRQHSDLGEQDLQTRKSANTWQGFLLCITSNDVWWMTLTVFLRFKMNQNTDLMHW